MAVKFKTKAERDEYVKAHEGPPLVVPAAGPQRQWVIEATLDDISRERASELFTQVCDLLHAAEPQVTCALTPPLASA